MKFPQIYRALAHDDLRPQMNQAYVTKDFTFASDAHIMVKHKTNQIFDELFVSRIPEWGIALSEKMLKAICSRNTDTVSLSEDLKQLILDSHDTENPKLIFNLQDARNFNFPNHNAVMVKESDAKPITGVCISTTLLDNLMKAMDPYGKQYVQMFFQTPEKAILCKLRLDSDFHLCEAVIMPAMF